MVADRIADVAAGVVVALGGAVVVRIGRMVRIALYLAFKQMTALRRVSLVAIGCLAALSSALAQDGDLRSGGLNPFPKDDVYRVHLIGDWFMDGLVAELTAEMKTLPRVQVHGEKIELVTLRRSNWREAVAAIEGRGKNVPLDMTVVMFGVSEIGSLFETGAERERFGGEAWLKEYAGRVDLTMKALRAQQGAVYWIGLPVVRRRDHSDAYQIINSLVRERAYANGVTYIDVYSRFQDENGAFSRHGPDLAGRIKLLRSKDGIYFTSDGYGKIVQLVMQSVRRDFNRVKSERVVTLAGNEADQSAIRRGLEVPGGRVAPAANKKSARPAGGGVQAGRAGQGGEAADDGRLVFETLVNNKAAKITLQLPRPQLSAQIMALVTRNQTADKPARLGDNAVHVLEGGVPLLSTVSPSDQSALALGRRRLSPTQSVFFKVWGKGERLEPQPGRADDFRWPPIEPKLVAHVQAAAAETVRRPTVVKRTPGMPPLPVQRPLP